MNVRRAVALLFSVSVVGCGGAPSASTTPPSTSLSASSGAVVPSPAEPSPAAPSTPPVPTAIGTITLDAAGCSLSGAPTEIDPGTFELRVRNATDGQAGFDVFRIGSLGSADALAKHVEVERGLAKAGKPFVGPPVWAQHVAGSEIIEIGQTATLSGVASQGRYGVVCLGTYPNLKTDPIRPVASVAPIRVGVAPKTFAVDDVESIVFGPADAPSGSTYDSSETGRKILTLPVFYMDPTDQQPFHDVSGFLAGRASTFNGDPEKPLYVSAAIVFEKPLAASTSLAAYEHEFRTTWGFRDLAINDPDLGDEGFRITGHAAVQDGEPGFYYLWRSNNLLLEAVGVGKVDGEEGEMGAVVGAMAREMERRTK